MVFGHLFSPACFEDQAVATQYVPLLPKYDQHHQAEANLMVLSFRSDAKQGARLQNPELGRNAIRALALIGTLDSERTQTAMETR
jgi:hypothetical protein